jgi:hypothetical protein
MKTPSELRAGLSELDAGDVAEGIIQLVDLILDLAEFISSVL